MMAGIRYKTVCHAVSWKMILTLLVGWQQWPICEKNIGGGRRQARGWRRRRH